MTPEVRSRQDIDRLLERAGWVVVEAMPQGFTLASVEWRTDDSEG